MGEKRGSSYQNLHSRPLSHEEYYCEYIFVLENGDGDVGEDDDGREEREQLSESS